MAVGEAPTLTEEQRRDLELLLDVVADPAIDPAKRRAAAESVLRRGWPEALAGLAELLRDPPDPGARLAIAEALTGPAAPPPALAEPLIEALQSEEAAVRHAVAAALGRYENGVSERLIALAAAPGPTQAVRVAAIEALATHRQPEVVEGLIALTGDDRAEAIRAAAFEALRELTGEESIPDAHAAWRDWWDRHRDLPRDRWLARLVRSLNDRNQQLRAQQDRLTQRLVAALNQVYLARPEEERSVMLRELLADPNEPVRLLGLRLAERKVLNAQPVSTEVRERLRTLLADPASAVRATAAGLLRDLDDEPASAIAADRLRVETEPTVLRACLSLLARRPVPEAIEPALALLDRASVRPAAAEMLLAAAEADRLDVEVAGRVRAAAGRLVDNLPHPEPELVRLLARLAEDADAPRLKSLLEHEDPAVQRAAAAAFLRGPLTPDPLFDRLGDPVLGPLAIEAIGRHGRTFELATRLLEHRPENPEHRSGWVGALVELAARLPADRLPDLDQRLSGMEIEPGVRREVLRAALDADPTAAARPELQFRLLEVHLASGQIEPAAALAESLQSTALSDAQRRRLGRLRLDLAIASADYALAVELARQTAELDADLLPRLAARLLDVAERALEIGEPDRAAAAMDALRRLGIAALSAEHRDRFQALRQRMPNPAATDATDAG